MGDNLDLDHVPSLASQVLHMEQKLGRRLTKEERNKLRNDSTAIAVPKEVHRESRTYAGRNTSSQIRSDAEDLCAAQCFDMKQNKEALLKYGFDEKDIDKSIDKLKERNLNRGIE